MKYNKSSYWLTDWENDDIVVNTLSTREVKSHNLYKLAASKRAISNFVNIVTNQSIPVKFSTRGASYTDGKTVVIGSNLDKTSEFDVAVGLALHEGSHIKLSNFDTLLDLPNLVPPHVIEGAIKKGITNSLEIIKNLWNYVEDRRIDQFVFNSAPGYRDYYRAMYDKYFNDKLIDKGLLSDEHTDETIESYMFRIINLHNKNTDLSKLKGLREIFELVGLRNILRLKSTEDTFKVALEMYKVMLKYLSHIDSDDTDENTSNNGESSDNQLSDDDFEKLLDSMDSPSTSGGDSSDVMGGTSLSNLPDNLEGEESTSDETPKSEVTLSDRQKELLKKKIQKQKDFMKGDVKKKTLSRTDSKSVDEIEQSGSELKSVGSDIENKWGSVGSVDCIVVKKMTRGLMESNVFPMAAQTWNSGYSSYELDFRYQDEVNEGIRLGTILGKKLQVRGEDRNTIFNRQKIGRIDKRMISSLGFGNENVFQYMETDSYKKANLHISVDASGSMGGEKWLKTLTNVVALCKAVDMIQNLSIQVSFRTSTAKNPYIVLAYDSRTDKFSKVKTLFGALRAGGTTPEGLCFEAIMKNFLSSNNDIDSYFLNLSDGDPYFQGSGFNYVGEPAVSHTRKMVKKIEGMGIKTLAYFISDGYYGGSIDRFKKMYGSGATEIDVTSVSQITKTVNKLFLSK